MINFKPRHRRKMEQARRERQRAQYLRLIGPLRIYLLIECAPLVVDPFDIADRAFKRAFADPGVEEPSYCDLRKIAREIVETLKESGQATRAAHYSLEKIFDPYLTEGLESLREVLQAVDRLTPSERAVIEGEFLHLLTSDYIAETVGVTASTKRGQKRNALAKLADNNVSIERLREAFNDLKGETP
ncbi:hypothetical protein ACFXAW_31325 [Streptomyces sp. NPDC059445]|uniref:hypothetical protein n=1 Tax=Streptomyces sp. NPDC059445 TaxID=3346832 RepID=UPI003697E562